jgi:hypothetical protein
VRPANRAEERVDRRLSEHQNTDKRCVLVVGERFAPDDMAPALVNRNGPIVRPRRRRLMCGCYIMPQIWDLPACSISRKNQ